VPADTQRACRRARWGRRRERIIVPMDIEQVTEIFRTNMTRLVAEAGERNRQRHLASAGPAKSTLPRRARG
jgi:hypothetical protein